MNRKREFFAEKEAFFHLFSIDSKRFAGWYAPRALRVLARPAIIQARLLGQLVVTNVTPGDLISPFSEGLMCISVFPMSEVYQRSASHPQ